MYIIPKCIVWWKAEGHGYTYDLKRAGIFTDEDKAKNYPSVDNCIYVPKEVAEAAAYRPMLLWWDGSDYPRLHERLPDVSIAEKKTRRANA